MAISSKPNTTRYHIRSISLPCESHPSTIKIEQELNKLKTPDASSLPTEESICDGLTGLIVLHRCVDDLLNLPLTQQAILQHQKEKWVNELLDGSVKLLDVCGITRDIVSQIKEHIRDFQCALRRRKADSSTKSIISDNICFRKSIKKDVKRLITNLKQVSNITGPSEDLDHHLTVVIRVLMEVSEMTVLVFESLLLFISMPILKPKPKSSRWSVVSKLTHKGTIACEDLQGVKMQIVQYRLETMEAHIEGMDSGLESLFRCLIRTRALLLNIVSQ